MASRSESNLFLKYYIMAKVIVFYLLFSVLALALAENSTDFVEKTFDFIDEARKNLKLSANKNLILLIGSEKSDKSLLVHYVAGNYSKLISIEPDENETEYKIFDGFDAETENNESSFRTLVPKMVIDDAENVWYDFPGFEDNHNQSVEIATAFLSNSVIEHAENVKIVLVVNCMFFTEEFDRVLTLATKLIENVDRYNSSVSLVMTKVQSYWKKNEWSLETFEESMQNSTEKFLLSHRLKLEEKELEERLNEKKIELIDALLEKVSKISICWRPNAAGAFDTIDEMVYGRRQIRKFIFEQTSYAKIQANDFRFPLSDATQILVANMERQTRDSITTILISIDNTVVNALQHSIQSIEDFHDRQSFLSNVTTTTNQIITFEETTLQQLTKLNIELNISSINTKFNHIREHEANWNILNTLAPTKIIFSINEWIANSSQTNEYVTSEYNWYSFLVEVFEYLVRIDVQRNVSNYNVANSSDWGELNKPQGLTIDENNFNEFKKRFPNHAVDKVSPSKLKELNEIIHFTLMPAPQFECNHEKMTIKGVNMRSSHIQTLKCPFTPAMKINVFVVGTFYVDSDLNMTGYRELNIFAAKWEILNTTTFHLNGLDGKAQTQSRAQFAGTAGNPGNAGTNAPNVFGMANEFVNVSALSLNFMGGNGASGQDGTESDDIVATFRRRVHIWYKSRVFIDSDLHNYYGKFLKTDGYNVEYIGEQCELSRCKLKFRIHPNKCCGRTGLGGSGGFGGQPGNFLFMRTDNHQSDTPHIHARNGSRGIDGQNAKPCKNTALDIKVDVKRHNALVWSAAIGEVHHVKFTIENRVNSNICQPVYTRSSAETHIPKPIEPIKFISEIIEYKTFLRTYLKDPSQAKIVRKTYDAIDSNAYINNAYSVADFVIEVNALEKQFYELNEFVDLLPIYDSLLRRIDAYGISNEKNMSASDRKVLTLISTTILSKTMSMRSSQKSDFNIDIENSFDSIVQGITKLNETERIGMINQQRISANGDIMVRINETNEYIANDVRPEIGKLYSTLDNEMEYVMDEPLEMRATAIDGFEMHEENAKVIQKKLCIRIVTGLLHLMAGPLPLFRSGWKFATDTIETVATNAFIGPEIEKFVGPNELKSPQIEPGNVDDRSEQEKIDAIEKQLHNLIDFLKSTKAENFIFDDKLNSLKSKHSITHDDVEQQFRAFSDLVNEQQDKLVAIEKVRDTLHAVTLKLVESISGVKSANGVENYLLKIDEAITLIIHIYDRMYNYQEQTKLAVYMNDLDTADYRDMHLDPQLKSNLNQLQFNFQANLILTQYVRAVEGFKQAVFPFADKYLDIYRLPETFATDQNIDTVVATVADKIKSLSERIKQLNESGSSIHTAYFDRDHGEIGPFYVWPNDEVRDKIQQLFAGKKIYLLADVTQNGKLNAIKFNIINVEFRSSNQTINDQLNEILQSFHVSLTHMGESNYRCDDQFYTISSRLQTIKYSFAKENDVPAIRNVFYDKLSKGITMLSPYTLWAMQLSHGQFDKLTPFVDCVDIELQGHGQYVSEGATICNTNLKKFYSPLAARPKRSTLPQHFTIAAANTLTHIPIQTIAVSVAVVLVAFLVSS